MVLAIVFVFWPIAKAIKMADKNAYIKVFTSSDKNKILINRSIMDLQNYVDDIEYYSKQKSGIL